MYRGVIISGTRGSGKSTLARALSELGSDFQTVSAITTRAARKDDSPGQYEYVDQQRFQQLLAGKELAVSTTYASASYGIRRTAIESVVNLGRIPIVVLAPDAVTPFSDSQPGFLSVFLDDTDGVLDGRLAARSQISSDEASTRIKDRGFAAACLYEMKGVTATRATLVRSIFQLGRSGGILTRRLIKEYLDVGLLLTEGQDEKIQVASYDLRLGDEYYFAGRIHRLSDSSPILLVEPYDYAIVTSHEEMRLPRDVSGRFDLAVNLFCQGVILSNGPQVDPGFSGTLFCLLLNTSSKPVLLKRRQHYATIEFHRLIEPTEPYKGKYQGKSLIDYLPSNAAQGAINELKKEIEALRKESQLLQTTAWAVVTLIMGLIAIWATVR